MRYSEGRSVELRKKNTVFNLVRHGDSDSFDGTHLST